MQLSALFLHLDADDAGGIDEVAFLGLFGEESGGGGSGRSGGGRRRGGGGDGDGDWIEDWLAGLRASLEVCRFEV